MAHQSSKTKTPSIHQPNGDLTAWDSVATLATHPDCVFCKQCGPDYRYVACNARFASLVGLSNPPAIKGLTDADFPWKNPLFAVGDQAIASGQKALIHDTGRATVPHESAYLLHITKTPLIDAHGHIYGILGVVHDIVPEIDRKRAFDALCRRAYRAEESQRRFLANISHTLRTPLTPLIMVGELLQQALAKTPHAPSIALMQEASRTLLDHINQLIAVADQSQNSTPSVAETPTPYSPQQLRQQIEKTLRPLAEKKELTWTDRTTQLPPTVRIAWQTLRQIALSVLSNAITYTDKGTIAVRWGYKDKQLSFTVKDTGCGLSEEDRQQLGTPFFMITPAYKTANSGLGLGLTLVQSALKSIGGTLTVDSTPQVGSTFTVRCPAPLVLDDVTTPQNTAGAMHPPTPDALPSTQPTTHTSPTVLIVEDNPASALMLRRAFESLEVQVIVATSAEMALKTLITARPMLLVTDLGLPGKSGIELVRTLASQRDLFLPKHIVALSAHVDEAIRRECLAAGMQAAYQKPLTLQAVKTLLAACQPLATSC